MKRIVGASARNDNKVLHGQSLSLYLAFKKVFLALPFSASHMASQGRLNAVCTYLVVLVSKTPAAKMRFQSQRSEKGPISLSLCR